MPYIVVKNDESVLSRVSPDALLSWIDLGVSRATEYRYAVLFETCSGALKCAGMQGGSVHQIGDWDAPTMDRVDCAALRVACDRGLGGLVEVE
jgi:hypothetical protein